MEKFTLPVAIVLSSVILGVSFYAVQLNKQESIERQHDAELQYKLNNDKSELEQRETGMQMEEQEASQNVTQQQSMQRSLEQCLSEAKQWEIEAIEAVCPGFSEAVQGDSLNCRKDLDISEYFDVVTNEKEEREQKCYRKYQ